jgi:Flp pilus assembly protein TadG
VLPRYRQHGELLGWLAVIMRIMLRRPGERGSLALELVILTPILVILMMFLVALGRLVEAQGQVDGAARDAARAASIAQSYSGAQQNAQQAATSDLTGAAACNSTPSVQFGGGTDMAPGGVVNIVIRCNINLSYLALLGIGSTKTIIGHASAPIDTYSVGG